MSVVIIKYCNIGQYGIETVCKRVNKDVILYIKLVNN